MESGIVVTENALRRNGFKSIGQKSVTRISGNPMGKALGAQILVAQIKDAVLDLEARQAAEEAHAQK